MNYYRKNHWQRRSKRRSKCQEEPPSCRRAKAGKGGRYDAQATATPSRCAAIEDRLRVLGDDPGADNVWWVHLLTSLFKLCMSEYRALEKAYEDNAKDTPLLAWRARNLCELALWCRYCAMSRKNALRIYRDAGRRASRIYDEALVAAKVFGDEVDSAVFAGAKRKLIAVAANEGVGSVEGKDRNIGDIAAIDGKLLDITFMKGFLLDLAQPTALHVMAPPDESFTTYQRFLYYDLGCTYFVHAFEALESQLVCEEAAEIS
jgi:hypothetical protein